MKSQDQINTNIIKNSQIKTGESPPESKMIFFFNYINFSLIYGTYNKIKCKTQLFKIWQYLNLKYMY
jgi:hypothetical protein